MEVVNQLGCGNARVRQGVGTMKEWFYHFDVKDCSPVTAATFIEDKNRLYRTDIQQLYTVDGYWPSLLPRFVTVHGIMEESSDICQ